MQVLPHMREAGGGLAHLHSHFPLPRPSWAAGVRPVVGSRHGQQMWAQVWAADVGQQMWGTSRGQQSWAEACLVVGKLGCWDNLPVNRDGLRNARAV